MNDKLDRIIMLPTAATQQSGNITTPQRALHDSVSPAALRAVADWNERRGHDERRRRARARHKAQAGALREVAERLEVAQHMQMRDAA